MRVTIIMPISAGGVAALLLSATHIVPESERILMATKKRAAASAMVHTRGGWGERALCDLAQARLGAPETLPMAEVVAIHSDDGGSDDASAYGDGSLVGKNFMWYVPTYYGKTFHPRSDGHKAIRDAVYIAWEEHGI